MVQQKIIDDFYHSNKATRIDSNYSKVLKVTSFFEDSVIERQVCCVWEYLTIDECLYHPTLCMIKFVLIQHLWFHLNLCSINIFVFVYNNQKLNCVDIIISIYFHNIKSIQNFISQNKDFQQE